MQRMRTGLLIALLVGIGPLAAPLGPAPALAQSPAGSPAQSLAQDLAQAQRSSPAEPPGRLKPAPGAQPSQCQLIAGALPRADYARFTPPPGGAASLFRRAAATDAVTITFLGHSTFEIVSPEGVTIATDYSGWLRSNRTPDVVTMNKAHSSHYTLTPDPAIGQVLHGWNDAAPGEPVEHHVSVKDIYIRNVPSDIRSWGGTLEPNGNSIFIFEVAGLCIGHLGHLHYELNDRQFAAIGRLDVLMVPVDGGLTMGAESMSRMVKRLRSALILPMHRRGPVVEDFLALFGSDFQRQFAETNAVTVSLRGLPKQPLILVLAGN